MVNIVKDDLGFAAQQAISEAMEASNALAVINESCLSQAPRDGSVRISPDEAQALYWMIH